MKNENAEQPAQQEPVFWAISYDGKTPYALWPDGDGALFDLEIRRQGGTASKMPLYTSPPAQQRHISYACPQCHWSLEEQPAQQEPVRVPVTDNTYNYAKSLAEAIFKQHFASDEHYASGRIVWGVNDTVLGILTQIDNMVSDMVRKPHEQQEPVAWNDEQLQMLNFLYGAGDFDGVWFDQKHPTEKGAFWWRKHLRRLFDTPQAQPAPVQGWKLVPVKPTREMVDALADTDPEHNSVWDAVLAAAPQPAKHEPFTHYRHYDNGLQDWADEKTIPLYTSPQPAQRTWVGLSDEEILQTLDLVAYDTQAFDFAYRIEAKLKEKNA